MKILKIFSIMCIFVTATNGALGMSNENQPIEASVTKEQAIEKIKSDYKSGALNNANYLEINKEESKALINSGIQLAVIHDRINDLIHSYSIFLYKAPDEKKLFIIFEGGFSGVDVFGFGPVYYN